jgi:hypothetical protein
MRTKICTMMVAAALLSATAVGIAEARATGNAQAIAVARAVKRAYEKVRAETFVTTGSWVMRDFLHANGAGRLSWNWSLGYVPRGWVPAAIHAVVALRHDHLAWMVVDAIPHCRSRCQDIPARFVLDRAGTFVALGSPPLTCYKRVGIFPWREGQLWFGVGGLYDAPVYGSGVVVLTRHARWTKTQTITETITVSQKTMLDTAVVGHVSRGGRKHPAFTTRSVISHPRRPVHLPTVHLC